MRKKPTDYYPSRNTKEKQWEITTFEDIFWRYPRYLLPYPDETFALTDIYNGISLHNMVCHNFYQCLFSQIYHISTVQTITIDDYTNSKEAEKAFQWHILHINYLTKYITRYFDCNKVFYYNFTNNSQIDTLYASIWGENTHHFKSYPKH